MEPIFSHAPYAHIVYTHVHMCITVRKYISEHAVSTPYVCVAD